MLYCAFPGSDLDGGNRELVFDPALGRCQSMRAGAARALGFMPCADALPACADLPVLDTVASICDDPAAVVGRRFDLAAEAFATARRCGTADSCDLAACVQVWRLECPGGASLRATSWETAGIELPGLAFPELSEPLTSPSASTPTGGTTPFFHWGCLGNACGGPLRCDPASPEAVTRLRGHVILTPDPSVQGPPMLIIQAWDAE